MLLDVGGLILWQAIHGVSVEQFGVGVERVWIVHARVIDAVEGNCSGKRLPRSLGGLKLPARERVLLGSKQNATFAMRKDHRSRETACLST